MEWQIREHYYKWDTLYLKCYHCKKFFSSDNFSKDKTKRFGFNGRCKTCDKDYHSSLKFKQHKKEYYKRNKGQYIGYKRERLKKMKEEYGFSIKQFHNDTEDYIKKNNLRPNECMICGDIWIIEFHHPSYKERTDWKYGVFLCKSCHRKIHQNDIQCPEPVNLVQLNTRMPTILTDKDLELCKR